MPHYKLQPHLLILSAVLLCTQLFAQQKKVENLPEFDNKSFHFGFLIGINSTDFILDDDPHLSDSTILVIEPIRQSGFNLGIVSDLHLGTNLNLRFVPQLSFAQRNLEYRGMSIPDSNGYKTVIPVESTFLTFPIDIKFRSNRLNNFAAYVLGGGNYSLDLASQEKTETSFNQPLIKIKRHTYNFEVGVGFDFFLQYFKFAPEIKFEWGIQDIHVSQGNNPVYDNPILGLQSKVILISFLFEG